MVWVWKIVNSRVDQFIRPFSILHHDERSRFVARDQKGFIKRYSLSQIRAFPERFSMLDDRMTKRKFEDGHEKKIKDPDEPQYDSDNVKLNVEKQSYGDQSITDDCDNVSKTRDLEITKARETPGQTENVMKESSKKSEQ